MLIPLGFRSFLLILAIGLAAGVAAAQVQTGSALGAAATEKTPPAPVAPQAKPRPKPPAHATAKPTPAAHAAAKPTPVVQPTASPHAQRAAPALPPGAAAPAAPAGVPVPPGTPERAADAPKGGETGRPLPRFAALHSDEVNLRTGPGVRYPIDWIYRRRDLPVEIEREFEIWRLIRDPDGVKGWVHQATLTGRRSFIIRGAESTLRRTPDDAAPAVARLKPGVVGRIRACEAASDWCDLQVGEYRGFLRREAFWGTYAGEAVN